MLRVDKLRAGSLPPLSFGLAGGECLDVDGPSGAGKTTLLRAIADLDPTAGHVFLDGAERREMPATAWRRMVRYLSAEPAWWTDTAGEAFAASVPRARVLRLLAALGLEPGHLAQPLATLSTGERQRLALARTVADEPKVLLLDEPTAALDAGNAAIAEELIRYQMLAGRAVILVSHDRAMAGRLANTRLELAAVRQPPQDQRGACFQPEQGGRAA